MGVACQLASWPRKAAESRFFFYLGVEQIQTTCFPAEAVGPWKICRPYVWLIWAIFIYTLTPKAQSANRPNRLNLFGFAADLPHFYLVMGTDWWWGKNGNAKVKKKGVASERTRKISGMRCLLTQTGRAHKPRLAPSLSSPVLFSQGIKELRS